VPIQQTQVAEIEINDPIITTGTMSALKVTDISPMVSGLVDEVYVAVGDRVKKGDPLLRIRQTEIRLAIAQLEHKVSLARAEFNNAKKDLGTNLGLSKIGAVSQDITDNTQTLFDIYRARLGIAEAQLLEAKQNLEDSETKAPFDGVITERNINEGAYIQTIRMGMGPPELQIQQIDIIVALVRIPETELSRISVGTPAKITIDGMNQTYDSQIHVINDRIDYETRTIDVRLGIQNDDYLIKPGLFIRAEIYPEPRRALVVSRQAVLGNDTAYVFTNLNGLAHKVPVTIRELDTQQVEILSGLKPGQSVLTGNNLTRLRDGSTISVEGV
jgi:RND family efflux transporter MFP subunit|tara:strand:+ start:31215 stop:32201 length:987 start_codon:yes stop_codon:yes gene_type:complete